MVDLYKFGESDLIAFFLVMLRLVAFVFVWPILSGHSVPTQIKVLFGLVLTVVMYPMVNKEFVFKDLYSLNLIMVSISEVLIGISLGFITRLFFFSIGSAGQLIGVEMGFSAGQLYNPLLGINSTAIEEFQLMLATLFFLAINGHHLFLTGVQKSFELIPVSTMAMNINNFREVALSFSDIVILGLKLASPVVIAILMMNICFGIINKTVPQINILVSSMPANMMVGFAVLILMIPMMIYEMPSVLNLMTKYLMSFLQPS